MKAYYVLNVLGGSLRQFRKAVNRAAELINDERHWRAVLKLAEALPRQGRMEGRDCWAIFAAALETEPEHHYR
jgi:hypothetical protein